MPVLAVLAALVAAAIHVWFFVLESLTFSRPSVWGRFGLRSAEAAEAVGPMAFNQGFYNLFLAAGVVGGLLLIAVANDQAAGRAIVLFACACMAGAGVVLGSTDRRLASAAAIQAVPPLIAIVAAFVL